MFSCYASEKKPKTPIVHDLEDNKNKSNINNEDLSNIHMDNLKKMDENALHKLKTKIDYEYRTALYENQINNDKIILYKKLIEQYKKTVGEDDEDNTDNINNFIEERNSILEKEILEMKNKNNDLHKEYLSLFDSLSLLTDPFSKVSRLTEKIYILENKIKEQENKLQYLEERTKYYSNYKNVDDNLTKDIFLELFENKNEDDNLNLIEEKSSESSSSSSSSEETDKSKEPINTISNNVGDIKISSKFTTHNTIPKEAVEDYKRMLGLIYKKIVDEDDEDNIDNINNFIEARNSILEKEILEMKNKNNDLHKEYLSLFDSLSLLTDPYSKVSRLTEKIYILENKLKEQEYKLQYLEERTKYYLNYKNVDDNLTKDIFLELFENKNEDDNLNLIEEKSSESSSSSSSSEETKKSKEPINTISNNVGDIKESNKFTTHNTIPKEAVEDYKRMLGLIYKKNYEQITKEYQKVISAAQNELLIKNNNLKKLNLIKNEIEMKKDPSKKLKIINDEEKIINEKRNKEKEKKLEFKKNKKNYLDKSEELEELKKKLENLNDELKKEEEEYNNIEKTFKENNETLNDKIKEGNQIEVELEDIKKQRDLLLEELFGKKYNNYNGILEKKNDNEENN